MALNKEKNKFKKKIVKANECKNISKASNGVYKLTSKRDSSVRVVLNSLV